MGKATIVGGGTDGLYTVDLDYGTADIDQQIADLQAVVDASDAAIDALNAERVIAQGEVNDASAAVDLAIEAFRAGTGELTAIATATTALMEASKERNDLRRRIGIHKLRKSNVQTQIGILQQELLTRRTEAWCCTYTEEAIGVVGTIEINGELPDPILVPECAAWTPADGDLRDRLAMSGAAAYHGAAILPGWQKFSPTYRIGTITSIDSESDTCHVTLEGALSSAQGLNINQSEAIEDVPIVYLDCNSGPFEVADRVVVKFVGQRWDSPQVIGFESNPKPCTEWLWAGVNESNVIPEGTRKHTAKIDPETLLTEQAWVSGSLLSVGMTRRTLNAPLTRNSNGSLVDPTTIPATVYWTPDHSHNFNDYGPRVKMAVNRRGGRMINALYGNASFPDSANDGDRLYSWPEGNFIKVLQQPHEVTLPAATSGGAGTAAINDEGISILSESAGLSGFPGTHLCYALYDRNGNIYFAGQLGTPGEMFFAGGTAIGKSYAAVKDFDVTNQYVFLINVATGALVGTLSDSMETYTWREIAIRDGKLFILSVLAIPVFNSSNEIVSFDADHYIERYAIPSLTFEAREKINWPRISNLSEDLGSLD